MYKKECFFGQSLPLLTMAMMIGGGRKLPRVPPLLCAGISLVSRSGGRALRIEGVDVLDACLEELQIFSF